MKLQFYILIGSILVSCQNKQSESNSTNTENEELRKMIEEDTFAIDTTIYEQFQELNEEEKKSLTQIALKPLKPKYKISELSIDKVLDVYKNLVNTLGRYKDSSESKQRHLDVIYEELEVQNEKLELNEDYPIELKLEVASIKSDIHFLRSNRHLKAK